MEANAQKLPRLGCHERRILLEAPPPDGESKVIDAPAPGRSADEANPRAIRKLWKAGLLWIGNQMVKVMTEAKQWNGWKRRYQNVEREYHKRAVWLSPLGQAVVDRLRAALESGKPIRWASHRKALVSSCRRQPRGLLSEFLGDVARECEYHQKIMSLLRMGGAGGYEREAAQLSAYQAVQKAAAPEASSCSR
jgi:hypothetical protein